MKDEFSEEAIMMRRIELHLPGSKRLMEIENMFNTRKKKSDEKKLKTAVVRWAQSLVAGFWEPEPRSETTLTCVTWQ